MSVRVALVGDVALDVVAPYFREAGYETYVPAGFGTWRQELLDASSALRRFAPDAVCDVTAYDATLSREVPGFYDARLRELASLPYSLDGIRAIVEEFSFHRLASPRKILAVDADNTLWKGILSEDGADALEPYEAFQRGLLALRAKGVVLVLLSKNDPFEFRADMPLDNAAFACVKTNWRPKAGNLLEACRTLGLSTDAVVFVDDNPHERAQMAAHLPEVAVVPFPADLTAPAPFLRRLSAYFFDGAGRTAEDAIRADDYAAARLRERLRASLACDSLETYLDRLELRAKPSLATPDDLDRLAQMAGKTNQFNATTRRLSREAFAALLADPRARVYVFRASDRFGEQGLVCYVVVDRAAGRITDFVMSCRAMGRTLEHFAYRYVTAREGRRLPIDFSPTAKNRPFREFLVAPDAPTHYRESGA